MKKRWCRVFAVGIAAFAATLICLPKTCVAGRVDTYRDGFTSRRLDRHIKSRIYGKSYKKGAQIDMDTLRYLQIRYVDFDGNEQEGEMIVNKKIAHRTLKAFYQLYKIKYPIEKMRLVDEYDADDEKSMEDNNTSAFNYRKIPNSNKMSNHSLGMAIDINPRINPYITSYGISPKNSKVYTVRDQFKCKGRYRDYMIHKGDSVYRIFKKNGFSWGGDWKHAKDYQHFEAK